MAPKKSTKKSTKTVRPKSEVNNFDDLVWEPVHNTKDKSSVKMQKCFKQGDFTRDGLIVELQKLSDMFSDAGKKVRLGIATHYENLNIWAPAILVNSGETVKVFDPSDSSGKEMYDGDNINAITFYVIKGSDAGDISHKRPKKFGEI